MPAKKKSAKPKASPEAKEHLRRLREFVGRNVNKEVKISWPKEIQIAKRIFETWPHEMLALVKVSFFIPSVAWFLTENGTDYLRRKKIHFDFRPQPINSTFEDLERKYGEDIPRSKRLNGLASLLSITKSITQ